MKDYPSVLSPTEIRFERLLPGPIENVWTYLTDARKRGEWLASGPMDPRVGGKVALRFKHADLSPNQAPAPEHTKEKIAGHDGRDDQRNVDEDVQSGPAPEPPAREQPRDGNGGDGAHERRDNRDFQTEPDDRQLGGSEGH